MLGILAGLLDAYLLLGKEWERWLPHHLDLLIESRDAKALVERESCRIGKGAGYTAPFIA